MQEVNKENEKYVRGGKNGTVTVSIVSVNGYENTITKKITAKQWGRICGILHEK